VKVTRSVFCLQIMGLHCCCVFFDIVVMAIRAKKKHRKLQLNKKAAPKGRAGSARGRDANHSR